MSAYVQSNTQEGLIKRLVSTATLVGKEGFLAKLVDATGEATVELCGDGECALFVIEEGAAVGSYATLRPLTQGANVRIVASGTIQGGVKVASDSAGKIATATAGEHVIGVLEEDCVSGQYALVRPVALGFHQASTAYTATQAAITDNSGGEAADGTIAVVTAPTAIAATLTDSTGQSGTHDDTLAATTTQADLTGGESPTEGEFNTLLAEVRVICQNASDTAQKVIETVAAQAEDRAAIVALTNAVKELSTAVNAARVDIAALETILNTNKITS